MADLFTKTGEYFMAYDQDGNEQVISFKHKATDSTFNDDMTLEEKIGGIKKLRTYETTPEYIDEGEIAFILEI